MVKNLTLTFFTRISSLTLELKDGDKKSSLAAKMSWNPGKTGHLDKQQNWLGCQKSGHFSGDFGDLMMVPLLINISTFGIIPKRCPAQIAESLIHIPIPSCLNNFWIKIDEL